MIPQKVFYISGAHATGKTTMIRDLLKYIKGATAIDFDQYYFYPNNFLHNQITRILNWYETMKNTQISLAVVDRSPFDALMYAETLYEFESKTGFTKSDFDLVHRVFQSIPPEYRLSGYIIFLNPSVNQIMTNIKKRNREASEIMFDIDFVTALHNRFERFYDQLHKTMPIAVFDQKYTADQINEGLPTRDVMDELQRRCWLQPFEIHPNYILKRDQYGLY